MTIRNLLILDEVEVVGGGDDVRGRETRVVSLKYRNASSHSIVATNPAGYQYTMIIMAGRVWLLFWETVVG